MTESRPVGINLIGTDATACLDLDSLDLLMFNEIKQEAIDLASEVNFLYLRNLGFQNL